MLRRSLIFLMILPLSLFPRHVVRAAETGLASVVRVVSLDAQGRPLRQGLGVIMAPEGWLLTSGGIFANSQGGLIKTASGRWHLIEGVVQRAPLQGLVFCQVQAEGLTASPVSKSGRIKPAERVWLPIGEHFPVKCSEVEVQGCHPISPRVALLDLKLSQRRVAEGTPVFNQAGEVIGMAHQLSAPSNAGNASVYFLCLNRSQLTHTKGSTAVGQSVAEIADPAPSPAGLFWQGMAASARRDWADALEKFNAAIKMDKEFPEAYYGRAQTRYFQQDYQAAVQDLEMAIRLLPSYVQAHSWLGRTREKLGEPAAAVQAYETAVKLEPDLPEAHFRLGQLAYAAGDFDQAARHFRQAREGFPDAARSCWYLGTIAQTRGNTAEAVAHFQQAIALNPQFFEAHLSLGKVLLTAAGRPREAVQNLTKAVCQRPQHAEARLYLALAHLVTWNRGGALEQYTTLQDLNPRLASWLGQLMQRGH